MRVLHVHQIAHIPQLLVRELRKLGVDADFVEDVREVDVKSYDIVHGHYALNRSTIRAFRAARKNVVPFVLHCHGSDLRLVTSKGRKKLPFHLGAISRYIRKRSSEILLSTPDLIEWERKGKYIANPVDLNIFEPMPDVEKSGRTLLCGRFVRHSKVMNFIRKEAEYDCINTGEIIKFPENVRMLPQVIYADFPEFLNRYGSMTASIHDLVTMSRLSAMACGLRTFSDFEPAFVDFYDGQNPDKVEDPRKFIERFHNPKDSALDVLKVYEALV